MFSRCPKCAHRPLPRDQSLPAACPACGVILAKAAEAQRRGSEPARRTTVPRAEAPAWHEWLLHTPARVDRTAWWLRALLLAGLAVWGLRLIAMDYRSGDIGASFLHGPLLLFHEAGHPLFAVFGEWVGVLGGTLGQLLMPAVIVAAFLLKNRDPFGAAVGLWLLGVSLLDVSPYMYDALEPQLMLLSGSTGEAGGHDWIYLFTSMGLRPHAQWIGAATHKLGALVLLLALGWAGWVLALQRGRIAPAVLAGD